MAQTTARAISDYGPINTWDIPVAEDVNVDTNKTFTNKYIAKYLNLMLKPKSFEEGNWEPSVKALNNSDYNYDENKYVRYYLNDGTSVSGVLNINSTIKRYDAYIDINGDKKPNKLGKDIFLFYYYFDGPYPELIGKFIPEGSRGTRETIMQSGSWKCNKNSHGTSCGALIMKDGWQIKDDYPW